MIKERLLKLRQLMAQKNIDVYIVPTDDPHLSEYVAERYKSRAYISGFTGSAGTFFITQHLAGLYTDGRYFIQAGEELKDTGIDLYKMGEPSTPTLNELLKRIIPAEGTLAIDPKLYSQSSLKTLKDALQYNDYNLTLTDDLVDEIWSDRPALPDERVFEHTIEYTGSSVSEKLETIRSLIIDKKATGYMLCSLNDIAWLFNIRGNDIPYTPVTYAYAYINVKTATLFVDMSKMDDELTSSLKKQGVTLSNYDSYFSFLETLNKEKVYYDPTKVNARMVACIQDNNRAIEGRDITFYQKAQFSATELKNLDSAQIRDGVAMVRFLNWFDAQDKTGLLNEHTISEKLLSFRELGDHFIEPSFNTIPAYGPNGAKMHYSTNASSASTLEPRSFFLIDSGGQYQDGTTDITRTIPCGPLTEEEMYDYTLVVKSHIKLNQFIFLKGATGTNLDTISRQPMWQALMDYKSGTGHSIGYVLGVHEGPARIRKELSDVELKPNMVLTNEPGVYKEGKYGIRIENTVVVKEYASNDMGTFYNFDVISYCPIDTRPIIKSMLDTEDVEWLNNYHNMVYNTLSPLLALEDSEWLLQATKSI